MTTSPTSSPRRRPLVLVLLVGLGCGFAAGWISSTRRAPPPPVDLTRDVTLYGPQAPKILRPHSVVIDNRSRFVGPAPAGPERVWTLSFDQGRMRIACSEVDPEQESQP